MTEHTVVVIGAGPGGIAAGVRLKQAGIEDFVVLERADRIGGSWRDNTYPGIGVDVPSFAYQYSFARNPHWSRLFPKGDEVLAYHEHVVERFGLAPHLRFGVSVQREAWDEDARHWQLHTDAGEVITARFVITAVGAFINAKEDPGIPGWRTFGGKVQRPTRWDHDYDLTGKRVAIVGTGASSVQITPAIAPAVGALAVFQRTPVWCLPKPDLPLGPLAHTVLGVPGVAAALHGGVLLAGEFALRGLLSTPPAVADPAMRLFDGLARQAYRTHLRRLVRDPATRAALSPDFGVVAKRPTISNGFLQAFNRDNVTLVTDPIERITKTGVRTADGTLHRADMLVLATGYELFSDPESYRPGAVVGRDGMDLGEFYAANRLQAYESVALPGLPNRWMIVGPYSWTATGWHALVEVSVRHAVRAITEARRRGAGTVEVRRSAHDAYHAEVLRRGRNIQHYFTALNAGVRTYYVNSQGDAPYIRPSTIFEARWASGHFPLDDYAFDDATVTSRAATRAAVA